MQFNILPSPLAAIGDVLIRIGLLLSGALPLMTFSGMGYWPWAGGVEIGASAMTGLITIGFAFLALGGDGRARAILRPVPAGLIGLGLAGTFLSPLWAEPARALFGHPAIGFGGIWLLLAGLVSAGVSVIPPGLVRRLLLVTFLGFGLIGLAAAVRLGAHMITLPFLALALIALLPDWGRRLRRPVAVGALLAVPILMTGLAVIPPLMSADRMVGLAEALHGAGWGAWHEITVAAPADSLRANVGLSAGEPFILPGHPAQGVNADPALLLAAGLPQEGAGRLTTGSVLGDLVVGLGATGVILLLLVGWRLRSANKDREDRLLLLAAPVLLLASLPPTLALAPIAGLLLARAVPEGERPDRPVLWRHRLLAFPLLAAGMGGLMIASALVRTADFAAHDRKLPPRFLEQAGACIATRSALVPERDVHVALQRMLIGRILTAQDPYAELVRQRSLVASSGCILEEHLRDRPGPLVLESRLEMRGAIVAVNRHLAEIGSAENPLEPQLGPWADDLGYLLTLAPTRTDLLDAFLDAALTAGDPEAIRRTEKLLPDGREADGLRDQIGAVVVPR